MKKAMLLSFLLLGGCAQNLAWTHNYKGQQEFYQDNSQCLAMSNGGGNPQMMSAGSGAFNQGFANGWNQGAAIASSQRQQTIYNQCMMGQGWYLTKAQ